MGVTLFLGLSGLAGASVVESPGELRQSLNGLWQFTTNAASVAAADAPWDAITVPGNWDTLPAYSTHVGQGWYRRSFSVPVAWQGRHIRLHFDAVYDTAAVWLNGQLVGTHTGGYTPFEFDVTKFLRDGENTVTVCADNTDGRGAWWHWGGISREVMLIANQDARIVWQHIRSEPDLPAGTARLIVRYKLANAGEKPVVVALQGRIDSAGEAALTTTISIPARSEVEAELATNLPKDRVRLWDFDHPNLYRLTTQISVGGKVVHDKSDRFGIRKIEVTATSLLLNGERIRVCGFNRVSDSNTTGNTEPDALVKQDVDLMKRAGAAFSRLMHFPQAPNLLDYLDEKGMMIFGEIPVWGAGDPNMSPGNPLTAQWMREMIERDYNHPCIIGWSVGNELLQHDAYGKSMINYTRQLDPHRLVNYVSFSGSRAEYHPGNDPISVSDFLMHNTYGLENEKKARTLHEKWPQLPIFYSEFGANQIGASPEATIPQLARRFEPLQELPYVVGISLWTFNDYRSAYKGTPASGNREWGVVTVDRRPKAAYAQIRQLYSPVHSLTVRNRVVRLEPRSPGEIPSYVLRGYRLNWKQLAASGSTLDSGEVELPDFKPGTETWTSLPLGNATVVGAVELVVQLLSPGGYDVQDCRERLSP